MNHPFFVFQIPVSVGVSMYEAVSLYKGHRIIASKGAGGTNFTVLQLVIYCLFGVLAGVVGGLLGLGGGFIMGPLFLELGIPPQVSLFCFIRCLERIKMNKFKTTIILNLIIKSLLVFLVARLCKLD